jgi:hypothetical protein
MMTADQEREALLDRMLSDPTTLRRMRDVDRAIAEGKRVDGGSDMETLRTLAGRTDEDDPQP